MEKKGKRAKGKVRIKDLAAGKRKGTAVKGGRIINLRTNASVLVGSGGTRFPPR